MLRLTCLLAVGAHLTFFLSACAPTDENVFSYQQRLASGKPIVFDRPGEQNPGCKSAWTDVRVSQQDLEDLHFIGALVTPGFGNNNCFVVGSEVQIYDKDAKKMTDSFARVSKVAIWNGRISTQQRPSREYKDYFIWEANTPRLSKELSEQIASYANFLFNQNVMSTVAKSDDGVVHITHLHLTRTGPNARALYNQGKSRFLGQFDEETHQEGDTLPSCGSRVFEDYRTSKETWDLIVSGRTQTAWDVHPGLLCVRQGSIVSLVSDKENSQTGQRDFYGKIKIGKMRRLTLDNLRSDYLKLSKGTSAKEAFDEIQALYKKWENNPKARLFLFDFEPVEEEVKP